ncbi:hypothetical protein [Myxococcus virescens]|uniref:Uncharacterized protein n=1 Tax=Myxococcus virescens TaxID=83456 RepID=A0A511HHC0_9BACT|nr:hypothetical protein [Myxococcus virescens]GEL72972.1 hypothetical protein MVI01_47560 [Myxococcus virescens]
MEDAPAPALEAFAPGRGSGLARLHGQFLAQVGGGFGHIPCFSLALLEWAHRYNAHWLLERHHFLSPSQAQRELMHKQVA